MFCRTHVSASSLIRRRELHARVRGSRFLQVDPVEGGSANDYEYAMGDPINKFDLDGKCVQFWQKRCRGKKSSWSRSGDALKWTWHHTEVSFGGCMGGCLGFGFQGGYGYFQPGVGCCFVGGNVSVARKRYNKRACSSYVASGAVGPVGVNLESGSYSKGRPSLDLAGGYSYGAGAGVGYIRNFDLPGGAQSCNPLR